MKEIYFSNMYLMQQVHVTYQFNGLNEPLEESIKKYVLLNLYVNPEAEELLLKPYYKKIFTNKPDARLDVGVQVGKNKFDKFDWIFSFTVDGKQVRYERVDGESFRSPVDLVNHAFAHFKRELVGSKWFFSWLKNRFKK